jgi:imidazolonepropionase-like amidohydrolase
MNDWGGNMEYQAVTGATIYPVSGPVINGGTLLWKDKKLTAVGGDVELPAGTRVIPGGHWTVTPGFIDAHTHLGILEEIYQWEGDDVNEISDPVTPALRALDGINPFDLGFQDALSGGVTTVMSGPGSANVVGGMCLIMKTAGTDLDSMVLRSQAGLKVAFGENPKHVYSEQKKLPYTRMGIAALLRQSLVEAQDYRIKREKDQTDGEAPERDLGMEALLEVLRRRVPLRAHAHRADDILTAIRIADEFNLDLVIEHATEGHKLIPALLKRRIPVVVGPTFSSRVKVEMKELSWKTAVELMDAGVLAALTTDHSASPIQYLSVCAALCVRYGMSEENALKAITLNPAKILKLDDRLGSLAPGKDADFVLFDGHPLDVRSRICQVFVDGAKVWGE